MSIRVLEAGMQTTIQAGPRSGLRHLGVPSCGAADPLSLALANRLVSALRSTKLKRRSAPDFPNQIIAVARPSPSSITRSMQA